MSTIGGVTVAALTPTASFFNTTAILLNSVTSSDRALLTYVAFFVLTVAIICAIGLAVFVAAYHNFFIRRENNSARAKLGAGETQGGGGGDCSNSTASFNACASPCYFCHRLYGYPQRSTTSPYYGSYGSDPITSMPPLPPSCPQWDDSLRRERTMAHSYQMYVYQQQKARTLQSDDGSKRSKSTTESSESRDVVNDVEYDVDTSGIDDSDVSDAVYECAGLASTAEMEVENPLFDRGVILSKKLNRADQPEHQLQK